MSWGNWQGYGGQEAKEGQMGRRATSAGNYGSPQAQLQQLQSQFFKWVGTELNEVRLHRQENTTTLDHDPCVACVNRA